MGTGFEILIQIYTDGGCSGNPGPGGWAFVIIRIIDAETGNSIVLAENWGAEKDTTNNRMELLAVISALEALPGLKPGNEKLAVFTDSQYVQKGITLWIDEWKRKGWKTSDKKPVKNQDLWQRLDLLAAGLKPDWVWVKGHAGNEFNERCDSLTQIAIASNR